MTPRLRRLVFPVVLAVRSLRILLRGLVGTRSLRELNYHLCRYFFVRARAVIARAVRLFLPKDELDPSTRPAVEQLDEHGFFELDGLIDEAQATALAERLARIPCHDPHRPELGSFSADEIPDQTHVAQLHLADVVREEAVLDIANDPMVLRIVSAWLGAKPTALIVTWWSTPAATGAEHAELFHRDKDDWKFIKLFVYLTEVREGSGPHAYVPGSHRDASWRFKEQRRYQDADIIDAFGADAIRTFTGPPGTAFLENTFGLHKGVPPTDGPRLLLQVTYSLLPLLYAPGAPAVRASELTRAVDPHVNRCHVDPER